MADRKRSLTNLDLGHSLQKAARQAKVLNSQASSTSKLSQPSSLEWKQKFLLTQYKVGGRLVMKDWLNEIDKLQYSTFVVNAFYLLEIQSFLLLVIDQESDNLFRINQIYSEQQKLCNGQLLKTYNPPVLKSERAEFVYLGTKFAVEVQKVGKVLKRHLLRDGYIQADGFQIIKAKTNTIETVLNKQIVRIAVQLNLEMQKALQKQQEQMMEQTISLQHQHRGNEIDMPSLGNMHQNTQKEQSTFIQHEETNSDYYSKQYRYDSQVPWLSKTCIFRLQLDVYVQDVVQKRENKLTYCLYFPTLRHTLRQRDYLNFEKVHMKHYTTVFNKISSLIKCTFTSTFYDVCIHQYKLSLIHVKKGFPNASDTQTQFSLSSYVDTSSQPDQSVHQSVMMPNRRQTLSPKKTDDQMKKINLIDSRFGSSMGTSTNLSEEQQYRNSILELNQMLRPINVDGETSPRKVTSHFGGDEGEHDTKPTLNNKRVSLTTASYIYRPENDGVISEQDEHKAVEKERQPSPPTARDDTKIRHSAIWNPTSKHDKKPPAADKKYVSNASSNQSQDLNKITEKSEVVASEDSFIDFFKDRESNQTSGPSKSRSSVISAKSSSDAGSKQARNNTSSQSSLPLTQNMAVKEPTPPPKPTPAPRIDNTKQQTPAPQKQPEKPVPIQPKPEKQAQTKPDKQKPVDKPTTAQSKPATQQVATRRVTVMKPKSQMTEDQASRIIRRRLSKYMLNKKQKQQQGNRQDSPTFKEVDSSARQTTSMGFRAKQHHSYFGNAKADISKPQVSKPTPTTTVDEKQPPRKSILVSGYSKEDYHELQAQFRDAKVAQEDTFAKESPTAPAWMNQSHLYEQRTEKGSIQILEEPPFETDFVIFRGGPYGTSNEIQETTPRKSPPFEKQLKKASVSIAPMFGVAAGTAPAIKVSPYEEDEYEIEIVDQTSAARQIQHLPIKHDRNDVPNKNVTPPLSALKFVSHQSSLLQSQLSLSKSDPDELKSSQFQSPINKPKTSLPTFQQEFTYTYEEDAESEKHKSIVDNSIVDNSIVENIEQYVDINNPPKVTRQDLLVRKVNSIMSRQPSQVVVPHVQLPSPVLQPPAPVQTPNTVRSKSLMNLKPKPKPKAVNSLLNVHIYTSNSEIRLLYQDEWLPFNVHFEQSVIPSRKAPTQKALPNRGYSPTPPPSLLRDIYQEYRMVLPERKSEYPYSDWDIFIDQQVNIQPHKHALNKKPLKFLTLHFPINVHHTYDPHNPSNLLQYLGLILQTQIIERLNCRQVDNGRGAEINGFSLRYLSSAFSILKEQLWSKDNLEIFPLISEFVFDHKRYHPKLQHNENQMHRMQNSMILETVKAVSTYEYYEQDEDQGT